MRLGQRELAKELLQKHTLGVLQTQANLLDQARQSFHRVIELAPQSTSALASDLDGGSDIFVCNDSASNFLFENDGLGKFEEIALYAGTEGESRDRLIGTKPNRDAVGSQVKVTLVDGTEQVSQVVAGRGYQSSFGKDLHFGLGERTPVRVTIRWIGGQEQSTELHLNSSFLTITQN